MVSSFCGQFCRLPDYSLYRFLTFQLTLRDIPKGICLVLYISVHNYQLFLGKHFSSYLLLIFDVNLCWLEVIVKLFTIKLLNIKFIVNLYINTLSSLQFSSVTQSCLTLCDPMNHSTPGLAVHHQLPEVTQTHVHQVGDAFQLSHPLSSPSPPAPNPSRHQSLFQ